MSITTKHLLVAMLFVGFPVYAVEPAPDPFSGPEPVVWVQTNPWLMVIGSDTPTLAIYENAEVICLDRSHVGGGYRRVTLTPERLKKIRNDILALGKFAAWKRNYNIAPNVTDLPSTILFVSLGEVTARTEIYGLMARDTRLPAYTIAGSGAGADELPEGVTGLYEYLASLQFEGSTPWVPQYVEVMFWPYDYAPQKSIHWPKDWPSFSSAMSSQHGELHSIYLAGAKLDDLREFLKTRKPKGALELDGKKWAVAYRPVFPSEPKWNGGNRED